MKKYAESTHFGVYNTVTKTWRNDIMAKTQKEAGEQLFKKIGTTAFRLRYDIRPIPIGKGGIPTIPTLTTMKKEKKV